MLPARVTLALLIMIFVKVENEVLKWQFEKILILVRVSYGAILHRRTSKVYEEWQWGMVNGNGFYFWENFSWRKFPIL